VSWCCALTSNIIMMSVITMSVIGQKVFTLSGIRQRVVVLSVVMLIVVILCVIILIVIMPLSLTFASLWIVSLRWMSWHHRSKADRENRQKSKCKCFIDRLMLQSQSAFHDRNLCFGQGILDEREGRLGTVNLHSELNFFQ
jgi:hypothetical protein